eukprot:CAMPEP_0197183278 /NCGR_PEP_ID=MMETSP1423-20130617/7729_1 /TAXON_ID=476441 /ORGANISM="Pseudo-nitzschia heimii, Strain UNC1101" /LENGTH=564 /DNA_ID=CAMNT_0042633841 /DNA_START=63 /DNA_END=1754 /DNA_ORIENTATION=+
MGKTKKPFIDKKNSSTYHILYRSQRDVTDAENDNDTGGRVVLWPSPNNNKETDQKVLIGEQSSGSDVKQDKDNSLSSWKNKLAEAGLVDAFDYEKHTKPIRGDGQYMSSTAMKANRREVGAMLNARALNIQDEIIQEVDRQLDSIALTSDCMDDEIAQMLFGDFEEGEFEELNDEFILDAAKEPEPTDGDEISFDYDSHIQGLIEKAKMQSDGVGALTTIHEIGRKDQEFFANAKRIDKGHNSSDDESGYFDENNCDFNIDGMPGVVPKLSEGEEKALCDKFNNALAEYDSDDVGEGYSDDDMIGDLPLEGDNRVESALDDFLSERKDDIYMKGNRQYMDGKNNGGSGFAALVGTKMVPIKDIVESANSARGDIQPISQVLGEADDTLRDPQQAPPAEEIFIDGKSYYSERMRNPWDCESILSTYSNLDNNPTTIDSASHRRTRKDKKKRWKSNKNESTIPEESQTIRLSEKTGMPLGVFPTSDYTDSSYCQTYDGTQTYMSVNKGEKRSQKETAEEKRLRKLTVKKERQLARMQKKLMKEAFSEEFSKRQQKVMVDDVGGKTV